MVGLPQGTIAQVETGRAHKQFVDTVEPDYVLLKIQYARQLLKRGVTADERFPDGTQVITTTSIRDGINAALPLEHNGHKRGEWDIVREFEPDHHIPADRSDYIDFPEEKRYNRVRECMEGTITIANHVADAGLDTTVLPWIKGVTRDERWLSYRTIEQLGIDYAVFYANSYFNSQGGNRRRQLIEDLEYIVDESSELMNRIDSFNICVLNCQSPRLLAEFPDEVVASSGLWVGQNRGWRETVSPTKQSEETIREIFESVDQRVSEALGLADESSSSVQEAESAHDETTHAT